VGALAWKAMDLWDPSKNAVIAEKDRQTAENVARQGKIVQVMKRLPLQIVKV
jgi:hypothetical protein